MSQEPVPIRRQVTRQLPEWSNVEVVALIADDGVYFPLKMLCYVVLGNINDRAQRARVQRDPILRSLVRTLQVETTGGPQQMVCLERLGIGRWINGINVSRMRPELRERFLAFQWELTRLADKLLFDEPDVSGTQSLGVAHIYPPTRHQVSLMSDEQLAQMLDYLARRIGTVELDMRQLKQWQLALMNGDANATRLVTPPDAAQLRSDAGGTQTDADG